MKQYNCKSIQGLIETLQKYWFKKGCITLQPLDMEVGAGTSHPITFFSAINPNPISVSFVQPSRRPTDSRLNNNPIRLQHYYQLQVIIKPSPNNFQDLYLRSLEEIGIKHKIHDIRFVEDNWENPTLGAYGIGWEVRINGIEVTQLTYFQKMGGISCKPIMGEITYGLERLSLYIQNKDNINDLLWYNGLYTNMYYKELYYQHEHEFSLYNLKLSNVDFLFKIFDQYEKEVKRLLMLKKPIILPAYEYTLKSIHIFNMIDARKIISSFERQHYILRINQSIKKIANLYYKSIKYKNKTNVN